MDLRQVERRRTALIQVLLAVIMIALIGITYTAVTKAYGPLVPSLTILSLLACLYVTINERKLRSVHDQLIHRLRVNEEELTLKAQQLTLTNRELTAKNRELTDKDLELDELDQELTVNRERLTALDQQLTDLRQESHTNQLKAIATVIAGQAHEITTPISAARVAGQVATKAAAEVKRLLGAQAEDNEDIADQLEALEDASSLLERNIERAFTLITAFRNQSSRQLSDEVMPVDLREVIADCIYAMRPVTKKHNVVATLHAEDAAHTWNGLPGQLTQVIVNLIQNALRHAYADAKSGTIDIRLTKDVDQERYTLVFEDKGAGIAAEMLPRIFDPMVTTARERGGTGLGLSITQEIVTGPLKGIIDCQSTVGEGTTLTITLPFDVLDDDDE